MRKHFCFRGHNKWAESIHDQCKILLCQRHWKVGRARESKLTLKVSDFHNKYHIRFYCHSPIQLNVMLDSYSDIDGVIIDGVIIDGSTPA